MGDLSVAAATYLPLKELPGFARRLGVARRRWPAAGTPDRSCMLRAAQQRMITGLRCLGENHGAAVVISRHGKTRRHIVAQERDIGTVDAVRDRQGTPRLIAVR